jgi:hypothetical protein
MQSQNLALVSFHGLPPYFQCAPYHWNGNHEHHQIQNKICDGQPEVLIQDPIAVFLEDSRRAPHGCEMSTADEHEAEEERDPPQRAEDNRNRQHRVALDRRSTAEDSFVEEQKAEFHAAQAGKLQQLYRILELTRVRY